MGTNTRRMTDDVKLRLTPELSSRIHSAAIASNETDASFIRSCTIRVMGLSPEINRRIKRRRIVVHDKDVTVLGAFTKHLHRLNGAVIQLAKSQRLQSSQLHGQTELVLSELEGCYRLFKDLGDKIEADFKNAVSEN